MTQEELETLVGQQQETLNKVTDYIQKLVEQSHQLRQRLEYTSNFVGIMMRTINEGRPLTVPELKESHAAQQAEQVGNIFSSAVKSKFIEPVDTVTDTSILLVQEFNESKQEINRRQELQIGQAKDDVKALFVGKKVGDEVGIFDNGQLKAIILIHDIFEPVKQLEQSLEVSPEATVEETVV